MEDDKLNNEQIDKKVEDLKERIKSNTLSRVKLDNSIIPSYKLDEYKSKKERNRKRNKIQKASRKRNR